MIQPGAELRGQVADFVNALPGSVFIAGTKRLINRLDPGRHSDKNPDNVPRLLGPHVKAGHFGALRGLNAFEGCETAVIVGREQPSIQVIEDQARAFAAMDDEPLTVLPDGEEGLVRQCRARRMRDGNVTWEEIAVHPDARVQAMLEQCREAEVLQAIDRVRPVFNRRTIYVLSDLVVDLTVDRIAKWTELAYGGSRIERAVRRTGVLALCPSDMLHVAPDL